MKILLFLIVLFGTAYTTSGQNTLRPKLIPEPEPECVDITSVAVDTLPDPSGIIVTGFDKPLRSSKETFFIVNNSEREIKGVNLLLTYSDMSGHQIHKRSEFIACSIYPGDTCYLDIPSWDRQKAFYFHRNPPYRPRTSATPFDVAIQVEYVLCPQTDPLTPII